MTDRHLPILAVDFDGCISTYATPWIAADVIPDPPVEGALDFLREATKRFRVCIFSSRCVEGHEASTARRNRAGVQALYNWFDKHGLEPDVLALLEFWHCKPPAHVTIDDRAMQFHGNWAGFAYGLATGVIADFRPWNHHLRHERPRVPDKS